MRGPRCHCGTPITRTPGKRPKVFCSDRCKKQAKRAREAAERTSKRDAPGAPREVNNRVSRTHLTCGNAAGVSGVESGKRDAETVPTEAGVPLGTDREFKARVRRSRRYAGRRTLWRITSDRACRGCGRAAMDPESGVVIARTADGAAVALGLMKCGRIWLCPVCSAKIRHLRAEEVTKAVVEWITRGGTAYLVTFTARHAASHRLDVLMGAMQGTRPMVAKPCGKGGCTEAAPCGKGRCRKAAPRRPGAYQRLITGSTWAGRKASAKTRHAASEGVRDRVGYIGMIRSTEVTVGEGNGWHPHLHCIVFVGGRTEGERANKQIVEVFEPSESALAEWQGHFRGVWTAALAKADPEFRPSDEHGVDFKRLETVKDAEDFGQYIAKTQDGKAPANELVRGDLKSGRGGNMAAFELLGRIGDLMGGVPEDEAAGHGSLPWCLERWAEYEAATKGRRAIEWTRYLRALLGLDGGDSEEDDLDLLFEMDGAAEFESGVAMDTEAWHKVAGRALDLAVTEAVEADQYGDVTALAVAAGAEATAVRLLTPGEVGELWESLLASLADRRERAQARRAIERAGE